MLFEWDTFSGNFGTFGPLSTQNDCQSNNRKGFKLYINNSEKLFCANKYLVLLSMFQQLCFSEFVFQFPHDLTLSHKQKINQLINSFNLTSLTYITILQKQKELLINTLGVPSKPGWNTTPTELFQKSFSP